MCIVVWLQILQCSLFISLCTFIFVSCLAITPSTLIRLDISPYNEFELRCSLIFGASSILMGDFSWTEESETVPGNTTLSMSSVRESSNANMVTSVLSVTLNSTTNETTPTYTYQCMAGVVGGNVANVSAMVTVRGMLTCPCSFLTKLLMRHH